MKVFVLHGEHNLNSYSRLQEYLKAARKKDWEIQNIESNVTNLRESLVGQSLFNKSRLFVLKDIMLLDKKNLDWLRKEGKNIEGGLLIHHKGLLPQRLLKSLPKLEKIEVFKVSKLIWNFLDSFFPDNAKNAYKLFHEAEKTDPPEFIFAMLAKHLRDIYWAKVDAKTLDYPSWRKGKLMSQAAKFDKEKLEKLIDELALADIKAKTSQTELPDSLDFLIATYLE